MGKKVEYSNLTKNRFKMSARPSGVSFILRVRNEEVLLEKSLSSLKPLTIPHEIIVICHCCTDGSRAVAERAASDGQPVIIFDSNQPLSRAGYETAITPASHPASLASFYNWCFGHGKYNWLFKWDADFKASQELLDFLNTGLDLGEQSPVKYLIQVELTPDIINTEAYLYNCLITFTKHVFWENAHFTPCEVRRIGARISSIPPTVLKPYWLESPWFETVETEDEDATSLRKKHAALIALCGPEPVGASRASNPECKAVFSAVVSKQGELREHGICLFD